MGATFLSHTLFWVIFVAKQQRSNSFLGSNNILFSRVPMSTKLHPKLTFRGPSVLRTSRRINSLHDLLRPPWPAPQPQVSPRDRTNCATGERLRLQHMEPKQSPWLCVGRGIQTHKKGGPFGFATKAKRGPRGIAE